MDQIIEFAGNHLLLVGAFAVLLVAIIVLENKKAGKGIGVQEATRLINRQGAVVVDLRGKQEFGAGHVLDAVNIPFSNLSSRLSELDKSKDKPVILVCKMGQHSRAGYKILADGGFADVRRLAGGMAEWNAASLPLVKG